MTSRLQVWRLSSAGDSLESLSLLDNVGTLDQASNLLPRGVYTSLRTYHKTSIFRIANHLIRLSDSAALLGNEILINEQRVRDVLRTILHGLEGSDFRIRLTVDLEGQVGDIYIAAEPLITPPLRDYECGVKVLARPFERENPRAKSTRFIQQSAGDRTLLSKEINEVLLYNARNEILEGISSNFFGILKGVVYTADLDILPGITRSMVLEVIQALSVPLTFQPVRLDEIIYLDEAFITSASRGVLPVRQIEGTIIGPGMPGSLTISIGKSLQARIEQDLEEI